MLRFDLVRYWYLTRSRALGTAPGPLDKAVAFWLKCETCPFDLPWFYRGADAVVLQLHRVASAERRVKSPAVLLVLQTLLWPLASVFWSVGLALRNGGAVQRSSGLGRGRQIVDCLRACWQHNLAPSEYYGLRAFARRGAAEVPLYFQQREKAAILDRLQPLSEQQAVVIDKNRFHDFCLREGLPTPAVLTALAPEGLQDTAPALPPTDLFRKPYGMFGGAGAELWQFDQASGCWCNEGRRLDQSALLEECRTSACLLQPVVQNHPAIKALAPGATATLRVVTLMSPTAGPKILGALLKIPDRHPVIDAYWAGALIAEVDLARGTLCRATARDLCRGFYSTHPRTGALIEGLEIPFWSELVEVVLRGQASLPGLRSLGWDVAVTATGPVIIEANTGWNFEIFQAGIGRPLGATPFLGWAGETLAS